jgi:hypothetical protein
VLTDSAVRWRSEALADRKLRVIREADEKTFEDMSLPEDTRVAIRRINEDYLHQKREPPIAADQPDSQPDSGRQAALEELLGVDGVKTFRDAEDVNALRVRPDNGRPWFHQSQQP